MGEQPLDARAFRRAMGHFATGVTIITARYGEAIQGMTANAVSSLSLDPLMILICVDRRAKMLDVLKNAPCFAVNILSDAQEPLSRHFSGAGHGAPPPAQLRFEEGVGAPLIANAVTTLTCSLAETFSGGDHVICIGRVIDFRIGADDAKPLIFFKGRYHHLLAPDPISRPAPEPWLSDSVSIYNEAWPDPLRRVLAGEHDLP